MTRILMRRSAFASAVAAFALAAPPAAAAPLCPGLADAAPAPPELQAKIAAAFNVPPQAARNAVARCAGQKLMACVPGANLNCGKADARRRLTGATTWCRANPNSSFIPMYATGHATVYAWRCASSGAVPGKRVVAVDRQGYLAGNWREIR